MKTNILINSMNTFTK